MKPPLNEALRVTSRLVDYIRAGRILDEAEKLLTPIEVTVVEKRYRLGIHWEHVAASINYSLRHTLEIHKEILKKALLCESPHLFALNRTSLYAIMVSSK